MTRQAVAVLETQVGSTLASLEVWSLTDVERPPQLDRASGFRTARGSRLAFGWFALRTVVGPATLVVATHAHLLPVTLPLVRAGARLVCVLHGIEAWKPLTMLQRAALRRAWRVAAVSRHTAARFEAANPELASIPVGVCHLAARALPRGPVPAPQAPRRERPFALIVGRMSSSERYKGHDALLEVWPRVRDRVPAARLAIAGDGDDRPRLERKAAALGIAGAVTFEGVVTSDRLAALYRDAAVFAMPSANEGFGLVYVEAMAAGTPCIAATGAAEEIVSDGVTGRIVSAGDREALAAALVEFLEDRAARDRMGRAALQAAHTRFSAGAFAERWCALLDVGPAAQPQPAREREAAC